MMTDEEIGRELLGLWLNPQGTGYHDYAAVGARARALLAGQASAPCPYVVTHGATHHCALAQADARDAARFRAIVALHPIMGVLADALLARDGGSREAEHG